MAEYLIQDTTLTGIANGVRDISGETDALSPANMKSELTGVGTEAGSQKTSLETLIGILETKRKGEPTLENKNVTVTENGTQQITPSAGFDGIGLLNLITNVVGGGGNINSAILDYFHSMTQEYAGTVATPASLIFNQTLRVIEGDDHWDRQDSFIFIHFPDATDPFDAIIIGWKDINSSASWLEIYPEPASAPVVINRLFYVGDATEAFLSQNEIYNITGSLDFVGEYTVNNGALLVW